MEKLTEYLSANFMLSARESEVVYYVCKGWSNKEVATVLQICEKTIKYHMTNILRKSKTKTRSRLIALCAGHVPENFPASTTPPEISA